MCPICRLSVRLSVKSAGGLIDALLSVSDEETAIVIISLDFC